MKKIFLLSLVFGWLVLVGTAQAQSLFKDPVVFAKNNPDGNKYSFIKHYIMSLEYFHDNESLVGGLGALSIKDLQNDTLVRKQMDDLLRANANLRVARNIMERYRNPDNALMLKVTNDFSKICDAQIEVNNKERELWNKLINSVKEVVLGLYDVSDFNKQYRQLSQERKGALNGLLEASILAGRTLISPKLNEYGHHGYLGISKDERFKLIKRIENRFSGEKYKGELRAGQTFLEASIVSIRDVLENFRKETLDG